MKVATCKIWPEFKDGSKNCRHYALCCTYILLLHLDVELVALVRSSEVFIVYIAQIHN